jgi:CubicO group peptidase (beta-lactamase class C family)
VTGPSRSLDDVLVDIDAWSADHAVAAIVGPDGLIAQHGDVECVLEWASVTKLVTAFAVLVAVERGLVGLDEAAGPPGSTVRHLLAHASGLAFEGDALLAQPGRRRIYSNGGFDVLGTIVAERAGRSFEHLVDEWILRPLGMAGSALVGRPAAGIRGSMRDLASFARELQSPTLIDGATLAEATAVSFPDLPGVVPGVGRFDPCDWGLGFELHDGKAPHWMGLTNSPATFGHFGGTGTFLWIDPVARVGLAVLTDRPFGPWALEAWPPLSDKVLTASAR